jgi:hypothetical protein
MNNLTWTLDRFLDRSSAKRLPAVALEEVSPEEVLIDDPRGDLTPVEMVDLKLLHLLIGKYSSASYSRRGVRH